MKYRKRKAVLGTAVLVPFLALVLWFAAAPSNRCSLYQNLGYVYLAKGTLAASPQLGTAEQWFSNSLLAGCAPASATYGLGQAYAGNGQLSPAIAALSDGESRMDLRHLLSGRIYEEMGQPEDAWFEYSKLPRDAAAAFYRIGDRAEKVGDYQQAIHDFSVATMINPAYPKAFYSAAFVYWRRLGDEGKAAIMIQRALAVDQKPSVERDFYQGLLCYYQDKANCAVAAWVSAVRETAKLDSVANPRYLAYEMLSQVLAEHAPVALGPLALVDQRGGPR